MIKEQLQTALSELMLAFSASVNECGGGSYITRLVADACNDLKDAIAVAEHPHLRRCGCYSFGGVVHAAKGDHRVWCNSAFPVDETIMPLWDRVPTCPDCIRVVAGEDEE